MSSKAFQQVQRQKFRITLSLEVMGDFDPKNIDWEKLLDIQGSESCDAYVEDLSCPEKWYS